LGIDCVMNLRGIGSRIGLLPNIPPNTHEKNFWSRLGIHKCVSLELHRERKVLGLVLGLVLRSLSFPEK